MFIICDYYSHKPMSKKLEADGEVEIKEMGLRGGRSKRTPERIE